MINLSLYTSFRLYQILTGIVLFFCFYKLNSAQTIDSPPPLPARVNMSSEVIEARNATNKILEDSGRHFKRGLEAIRANRLAESGQEFDKSVEQFLYSTLNIQKDQRLQSCYGALIETLYLIEFPSETKRPQIQNLSGACGWKWNDADYKLADEIVTFARVFPKNLSNSASTVSAAKQPDERLVGFIDQGFEPSPLDELSKLETTPVGETWRTISARTGVSVAELVAANPGMKEPKGKVFIPLNPAEVLLVKAQAGDTVTKLATRYGVNALEVARYNGLLPNSILGAGREIRILKTREKTVISTAPSTTVYTRIDPLQLTIGPKPRLKDGQVEVVMDYFNEVLHDPYSMRVVRWSPITESYCDSGPCWRVSVKYRARNVMGAYVLTERVFYMRNNAIVSTLELK